MSLVDELLTLTDDLSNLESFEFVYGINDNYLFIDGHLGISNQIIKELYCETKGRMEDITVNRVDITDKSKYLQLSFILCCISPRDYTIYNRRKDCIGSSIDLMLKELDVISLLQFQYPKVPELWDHRRYFLRLFISNHILTEELIEKEIDHCYIMCDKYPRNYYSWTTLQVLLPCYSCSQVVNEIHKNKEFYSTHIKDYSSLFRRQILFKELHKRDYDGLSLQKMLMEEIEWIQSKQRIFGSGESMELHLECINKMHQLLS